MNPQEIMARMLPHRGTVAHGSFGTWTIPPPASDAGWEQVRDHASIVGYVMAVGPWQQTLYGIGDTVDQAVKMYLERYYRDVPVGSFYQSANLMGGE